MGDRLSPAAFGRRLGVWSPLFLLAAVCWLGITFVSASAASPMGTPETETVPRDLVALLPADGDLPGWAPFGAPQYAAGDDLYILIDGGAEIYHEFGFKRLILRSYRHGENGGFNMEVYHMEDDAAAFGAYSYKTGEAGQSLAIGDEALLEDYYLNVRKGSYVITATGMDGRPETLSIIAAASRFVCERLPKGGEPPDLVKQIPAAGEWSGRLRAVKYIEGPLALYALIPRDGDLFAVQRAAAGLFEKCRWFVFQYDSPSASHSRRSAFIAKHPEAEPFILQKGNFLIYVDGNPGTQWRQTADAITFPAPAPTP